MSGSTPLYPNGRQGHIATGPEWNTVFGGNVQHVDGAPLGHPSPPIPQGQNPYYTWDAERQKFVPMAGSPADR